MRRNLLRALQLVALLAATAPGKAHAQRIGFEVGMAGVENFDGFAPSLGISGYLPVTDRFRASAAYGRWVGCDNNNAGCAEPRAGYGNQSINLVGLFRVAGSSAHSASLGAGLGWYEMLRVRDGETDSYLEDALTLSGELRRAVAFNSALYLRGDVSFPTDDNQPRWSSLRVGVDVGGIF